MYRVISFDFWEDKLLNEMGFHSTYGEALEQAKEIAKRFNGGNSELDVSEYSVNEVMVKGFDVNKGALVQASMQPVCIGEW